VASRQRVPAARWRGFGGGIGAACESWRMLARGSFWLALAVVVTACGAAARPHTPAKTLGIVGVAVAGDAAPAVTQLANALDRSLRHHAAHDARYALTASDAIASEISTPCQTSPCWAQVGRRHGVQVVIVGSLEPKPGSDGASIGASYRMTWVLVPVGSSDFESMLTARTWQRDWIPLAELTPGPALDALMKEIYDGLTERSSPRPSSHPAGAGPARPR